MRVYLTGSTGFIGNYLIKHFSSKYNFSSYVKKSKINIQEEIVIHLAGKAHDLKNITKTSEYYSVNTDFTKIIYDAFLISPAKTFIFFSSVKAAADDLKCVLTEDYIPNPITHYGKSKLLAEQYILSKEIPFGKRVYILRPCMIHGPGNKGNLNLLFQIVSKGFPWPLGAYNNKRSYCSIDNLCFILDELINNEMISSGIYNIADDVPLSTNDLIELISEIEKKNTRIWFIPKFIIQIISRMGDFINFPLNTERLGKLTETYLVSNKKIKDAIGKTLPVTSIDGLSKTIRSFKY